jgi:hypothetical protein
MPLCTTVLVLIALLAFPRAAHAYIDPGTGSLILQGLVAMFVGAAFTLKTFFRERITPIIDWILRRPRPKAAPEDPDVDRDPR